MERTSFTLFIDEKTHFHLFSFFQIWYLEHIQTKIKTFLKNWQNNKFCQF